MNTLTHSDELNVDSSQIHAEPKQSLPPLLLSSIATQPLLELDNKSMAALGVVFKEWFLCDPPDALRNRRREFGPRVALLSGQPIAGSQRSELFKRQQSSPVDHAGVNQDQRRRFPMPGLVSG